MVGSSSARAAARLAWSLWGFSLALTVLGLVLLALNLSYPEVHIFDYWVEMTVIAVTFSTVGAVIASRRPENPIGWLFCAIGLLGGARHLGAEYATYTLLAEPGTLPGGEALAWIIYWTQVPLYGLFVFAGLLFPNGRLPSSHWRPFAWLTVLIVLAGAISVAFSPGPIDGLVPIYNPLGMAGARDLFGPVRLLLNALLLVAALSLFVRLRNASEVERQQLKWIAYAAAVAVGGAVFTYVVFEAVNTWWISWPRFASFVVGFAGMPVAIAVLRGLSWSSFALVVVGLAGIPIAVGIAILRYRLWDIDRLINRTLVYSALTGVLLFVYVGGIVVLQELFRFLTGQGSELAVVVSTLAIVALFSPLRQRVQEFIDRRFYRRKYDAAKTLEAFGAKLRHEMDLDALSGELLAVVEETMQPAHVSLWLREPEDGEKLGADGKTE